MNLRDICKDKCSFFTQNLQKFTSVYQGFPGAVRVASDPNGTREALINTCELLKILREKGAFILADVSEIHYDKGYGFTLFTTSGSLPVKIGSGDFDAKVVRFARIYRELMAQQPTLRYIDLDYNDKIVIKKS